MLCAQDRIGEDIGETVIAGIVWIRCVGETAVGIEHYRSMRRSGSNHQRLLAIRQIVIVEDIAGNRRVFCKEICITLRRWRFRPYEIVINGVEEPRVNAIGIVLVWQAGQMLDICTNQCVYAGKIGGGMIFDQVDREYIGSLVVAKKVRNDAGLVVTIDRPVNCRKAGADKTVLIVLHRRQTDYAGLFRNLENEGRIEIQCICECRGRDTCLVGHLPRLREHHDAAIGKQELDIPLWTYPEDATIFVDAADQTAERINIDGNHQDSLLGGCGGLMNRHFGNAFIGSTIPNNFNEMH